MLLYKCTPVIAQQPEFKILISIILKDFRNKYVGTWDADLRIGYL